MKDQSVALVLFSGGQASTTCLAWAMERFERVETVGFDYGQRHRIELACRQEILSRIEDIKPAWRGKLGEDHMLDLSILGTISDTSLTREAEITLSESGLPNTFVPGRNIMFLTMTGALAYRRGLRTIVTGVCETDFSGYPDCRDDTIKAVQVALNLGLEARFNLVTPLMWRSKAETWELSFEIGGHELNELIVEHSHTCYVGDRSNKNKWGYGCGICPACELRREGFQSFMRMTLLTQS